MNTTKNLDAAKFFIQFFFSFLVISLCIFKLCVKTDGNQESAIYWGGLLSVIGYWMPSPSHNSQNGEVMSAYVDKQTNVLSDSTSVPTESQK